MAPGKQLSSMMSPKAEHHSLCSARHWEQGLIETKTWTHEVGQLRGDNIVVCLLLNWFVKPEGFLPLYWGLGNLIKTYLISLSSRSASFFCFLISSRLRSASARSLTARSRSRRRLSHRVLGRRRDMGRWGTLDVPSSSVQGLYKTPYNGLTLCSPSLLLFCPSLERPNPVDI